MHESARAGAVNEPGEEADAARREAGSQVIPPRAAAPVRLT